MQSWNPRETQGKGAVSARQGQHTRKSALKGACEITLVSRSQLSGSASFYSRQHTFPGARWSGLPADSPYLHMIPYTHTNTHTLRTHTHTPTHTTHTPHTHTYFKTTGSYILKKYIQNIYFLYSFRNVSETNLRNRFFSNNLGIKSFYFGQICFQVSTHTVVEN